MNSNVLFKTEKFNDWNLSEYNSKQKTKKKEKKLKKNFQSVVYVALFRRFEVQIEREINSSGNGQCVVCYLFFRSPILVVTLNQLDENFRATHETYIYLTQTTEFCDAK